jgi:carboxypeptidase D
MIFFLVYVSLFSIFSCEVLGVGCEKAHTHCDKEGFRDVIGLSKFVREINSKYPALTSVFTIGQSEQGREILVLEISDKPGVKTEFEPNIKFIANLHGDENVGTNVLIQFIDYILLNYDHVPRIKKMIDSMHLYFALTVNPDGYFSCKRENANGIDLNRDFPDRNKPTESFYGGRAIEVINLMKWVAESDTKFMLSTNYHGGAYVANYPWDSVGDKESQYSDDNDIFVHISKLYARSHPSMMKGGFKDGITNGKDWYPIYGGMQDFNYIHGGCMELTLEVSCDKWPQFIQEDYKQYFNENKDSMLDFAELGLYGLRGHVVDKQNRPIPSARIEIVGRKHMKVHADSFTGKFFRLVPAGSHTAKATALGYHARSIEFTYVDGEASVVEFVLEEDEGFSPPFFNGSFLFKTFVFLLVGGTVVLIARAYLRKKNSLDKASTAV